MSEPTRESRYPLRPNITVADVEAAVQRGVERAFRGVDAGAESDRLRRRLLLFIADELFPVRATPLERATDE